MTEEINMVEKNPSTEFELSDGRICKIEKGKGKDATEAMKVSGQDSSKYLFALISRVTTIDGNKIVAEDLDEMPLNDVLKIQTEFAERNF
jgi:hypothetical protein